MFFKKNKLEEVVADYNEATKEAFFFKVKNTNKMYETDPVPWEYLPRALKMGSIVEFVRLIVLLSQLSGLGYVRIHFKYGNGFLFCKEETGW